MDKDIERPEVEFRRLAPQRGAADFRTDFRAILGPISGFNSGPKWGLTKNGTSFGTSPSASQRSASRQNQLFARLSERCRAAGNIYPARERDGSSYMDFMLDLFSRISISRRSSSKQRDKISLDSFQGFAVQACHSQSASQTQMQFSSWWGSMVWTSPFKVSSGPER